MLSKSDDVHVTWEYSHGLGDPHSHSSCVIDGIANKPFAFSFGARQIGRVAQSLDWIAGSDHYRLWTVGLNGLADLCYQQDVSTQADTTRGLP
jgi:hypothetical protein